MRHRLDTPTSNPQVNSEHENSDTERNVGEVPDEPVLVREEINHMSSPKPGR